MERDVFRAKIENNQIIETLKSFITSQGFKNSEMQIEAWKNQVDFLVKYLPALYENTCLVFEYVIEEGYIRPDVLIFLKDKIIILEFKMKNSLKIRDALQLNNYKETLNNFHEYTWTNKIKLKPYLVLTQDQEKHKSILNLNILNEVNFEMELEKEYSKPMKEEEHEAWLNSSFEAIPSLLKPQ